jgi:predicted anti-sigma-YlaC factor YlaD
MMSCKQATHLLSQQLDRPLDRRESMSLRFHLMMCTGCTNFKQNLSFLRKTCERVGAEAVVKEE